MSDGAEVAVEEGVERVYLEGPPTADGRAFVDLAMIGHDFYRVDEVEGAISPGGRRAGVLRPLTIGSAAEEARRVFELRINERKAAGFVRASTSWKGPVRVLSVRLRHIDATGTHAIDLSLLQIDDASFTLTEIAFVESHRRHLAVKNTDLQVSTPDAIAAFEERRAEAGLAGYSQRV